MVTCSVDHPPRRASGGRPVGSGPVDHPGAKRSGTFTAMGIDFSLSPELEEIRLRVRTFVDDVVRPGELDIAEGLDREAYVGKLVRMRKEAMKAGLWLPHMPAEYGGMGLGHTQLAMVQA